MRDLLNIIDSIKNILVSFIKPIESNNFYKNKLQYYIKILVKVA